MLQEVGGCMTLMWPRSFSPASSLGSAGSFSFFFFFSLTAAVLRGSSSTKYAVTLCRTPEWILST